MNRFCRSAMPQAACALVVCSFAPAALAQSGGKISSRPTTLASTAERMVSYRHQEHMWQTADGSLHVLINTGDAAAALVLFSSHDDGITWSRSLTIDATDANSTGDGGLAGDVLTVTYLMTNGRIGLTHATYDSVSRVWTAGTPETVFSVAGTTASNPAFVVDNIGTTWCAFVTRKSLPSQTRIQMFHKPIGGSWVDTGLTFGPTERSPAFHERSARPVLLSGGVGMVYTVHKLVNWAFRPDGAAPDQAWTSSTLFTSVASDLDPYASHFSLATDPQKNIHLAFTDAKRVMYYRFLDSTQTWEAGRALPQAVNAGFVQVTSSADRLSIFANDLEDVQVLQSADGGVNFDYVYRLVHPPKVRGSKIDYGRQRLESPGLAIGPSIQMLQQYMDGSLFKLLSFSVPR